MADTPSSGSRKLITTLVILALVVIGAVIVVRGCHQPNSMEEQIDPDDQLPGTMEGTGSLYPEAAPLLAA